MAGRVRPRRRAPGRRATSDYFEPEGERGLPPVRYERLDDGQADARFLLGIRLDETGDRPLFADYMKGLKK